jgi:hypothetical protein
VTRCERLVLIGVAAAWLAVAPHSSRAEVRVLEVVGAVPLDEKTRGRSIPKDRAIEEALWEGVSRVAGDLLIDSVVPETGDGVNPIREALGRDMVPYTRSFRIVDDQGERPSLFTEHPDAATEYVVVVEVQVEADRVRERLVAAGLLDEAGRNALKGIEVEIRDLTAYAGYEQFVALLKAERVGAASVSPLELDHGRAVLQVEAEWGPAELLERLLAAAPASLRIRPIAIADARPIGAEADPVSGGPARLTLSVKWTPPVSNPDASPAPVGTGPGRVPTVTQGRSRVR